jgi:hypothetical protein
MLLLWTDAQAILVVWGLFLVPFQLTCMYALNLRSYIGVKNPIRLARSILDYTRKPDPLGRIPPLCVRVTPFITLALIDGCVEQGC